MPSKRKPRKKQLDPGKTARRVARNVIGSPPVEKVIVPKNLRKKEKHKRQAEQEDREA